jgi:glutamine synthetase
MAKWNAALPGSSGHLHQSLSRTGSHENLFSGDAADGGMSELMRQYVAGLVTNMPELTAIFCPTINSYKRTVPGAWAPVNATWGVDNRTTAVRAIPTTPNKWQIHACGIASYRRRHQSIPSHGGIARRGLGRNRTQAGASAAHRECLLRRRPPLPRTLADATRLFRQSRVAREWLGEQFVDHYASTREWEVRQYEKAVTDWELARYFESV